MQGMLKGFWEKNLRELTGIILRIIHGKFPEASQREWRRKSVEEFWEQSVKKKTGKFLVKTQE